MTSKVNFKNNNSVVYSSYRQTKTINSKNQKIEAVRKKITPSESQRLIMRGIRDLRADKESFMVINLTIVGVAAALSLFCPFLAPLWAALALVGVAATTWKINKVSEETNYLAMQLAQQGIWTAFTSRGGALTADFYIKN